ncbi:NADH-ubiquinone oxidoreductase-F iron-sulfur binding region domain-containing protein [Amycolatopsis thermoflava]|uniref:NADH-ubiquinone oxidoreductase-F iron-sulfur binding region domain-containing protein n=1 Tax=Amycolatopsis thermoflava TaxID=84480 RepID=UPI003646D139
MTVLEAAAPDLAAHESRNGPIPWGRDVVGDLAAAGLTGRGGAGFPAARKLAGMKPGGVVIANGAEGEPASRKDHTLLSVAPHLVLDGLQLVAEAAGAREVCCYVSPRSAMAVRGALAERREWDARPVRVVVAPETFLAGQESAVIAAVEGRRAVPADRLRPAVHSGYLVHNVETLAHVAQIVRYGPAWFRSRGTADEPGTFLATVGGAVRSPGVYEVPFGTPLPVLLDKAGGAGPLRAVLVGGYHGAWMAPDVTLSRAAAGSLGAGVVVALGAADCGLQAAARIGDYLARESARQCGPCRNGLPALAGLLSGLAAGDADLARGAGALASLVEGRGACHHPDGTARFVRSTVRMFADEIARHGRGECVARR